MHSLLTGKTLIAFDLDGTLIDSVPDLAAAVGQALAAQGLAVPTESEVRHWVGNGAPVLVERALSWALAQTSGQTPDEALNARTYADFLRFYAAEPSARTRLYPGVKPALEALHGAGFSLALITNKPARFIDPILESFGLNAFFSLCLGGDSLAQKKPDPLPLNHAAKTLGVEAHACVMVGDSRHDMAAGKAAGFTTVALPYGYNHGEPIAASHPDWLLDSLSQLLTTETQD